MDQDHPFLRESSCDELTKQLHVSEDVARILLNSAAKQTKDDSFTDAEVNSEQMTVRTAAAFHSGGFVSLQWIGNIQESAIAFVPTHCLPQAVLANSMITFDDFTVVRSNALSELIYCSESENPDDEEISLEEQTKQKLADEAAACRLSWKRKGEAEDNNTNTLLPWDADFSYFSAERGSIEDTLLDLGPGSSGLQLFDGAALVGILTGCLKSDPNVLIFLNVKKVAFAARMCILIREDSKSGRDSSCFADASSIGVLRYVLKRDTVVMWSTSSAEALTSKILGSTISKDTEQFRVGFLLCMCCEWAASQCCQTSRGDTSLITQTVIDEWVACFKNKSFDNLPTRNIFDWWNVAAVVQRCSGADIELMCELILSRPYKSKFGKYPAKLFYALFVSCGKLSVASKCWLPHTMRGAYSDFSSMYDDRLPKGPMDTSFVWYPNSEIPYKDATSVDRFNASTRRPTSCHHPFLCEISESGTDKASHWPHSHICVRLSHLVMAPKNVNSRHLVLQNAARAENVTETFCIDCREQIVKSICP